MKLLPIVKQVKVKDPYKLVLVFTSNEVKIYDMEPLLLQHPKDPLNKKSFFKKAHVAFGTVEWNDEISICPDSLYLKSTPYPAKDL